MDAVQHFEIPYKNRERAKKFYFQAFGWQLFDVPGSPYTFVTTVDMEKNGMPKRPGAINGGLAPRSKQLSAPTVLVKVTDLKNHLTRIEHAGGEVLLPPTPMGPVWYARFRDPEGNVLGAIQDRPEGMEPAAAPKKTARAKGKSAKPARKAKAARATKASKAAPPQRKPARKARKPRAKPEPKPVWSR